MALKIYNGIAGGLFKGLSQVRMGGELVTLLDSHGDPLSTAVPGVAPIVMQQPRILPLDATIGDSVTLTLGSAFGTPAPAASWDLTLDGRSIKTTVDEFMALELTAAGTYELTVEWANGVSPAAAATSAQLVVQPEHPVEPEEPGEPEEPEEPEVPAIDYASVALAYIDADTPFEGSATDVTAINARGKGGYRFAKTGTGTAIQRTAEGFAFADGAYVQSQALTGQANTDGIFAVVAFTLPAYGSNVGQLLDGGGGHVKLRNNAGSLQVVGQDDTAVTLVLGPLGYNQRVVAAGQIDDLLDLLSGIKADGGDASVAHAGITDPSITRASFGRYVNGTIHRLAIIGRAEGEAWPVTMREVYADFRAGA